MLVALAAGSIALMPGAAVALEGAVPTQGASVRLEPMGGDGVTVAGSGTYRGAIEVRRSGARLAVVNHLTLEEYVRGIDEVPPSWPAAALQAQAVAARTYAAHTAVTGDTRWRAVGADICATSVCQVYRGIDAERRAQGYGWLAAVEATAGRALLAGGQPIMASYSSTANGPQAMSQNGALAMANEGRSAGDILQSYYGIRPTLATGRLPSTIRVALVMSTASVRVSATGGFRVLDGAGAVLATSGPGEWRMAPAGDGVKLVPPDDYQPKGPTPAPAPVAPEIVAEGAEGVRLPARVIVAVGQGPRRGPWALTAVGLVVAAGAATVNRTHRRRTRTAP